MHLLYIVALTVFFHCTHTTGAGLTDPDININREIPHPTEFKTQYGAVGKSTVIWDLVECQLKTHTNLYICFEYDHIIT